MDVEAITDSMQLSFADTPFPVVMEKLIRAGVVAYAADLIALRKTYYDNGTGSADEPLPLADAPAAADRFDPAAVQASLRAIQQQEIGYAEFLRRIMQGGCARYIVFLGGRKAMYFGRDGDFFTERLPTFAQ